MGGDVALAHQEVARGLAHRDGAVGEGGEGAVGQGLVGRHARVGEVLVQHERGSHAPRGQASEIGGGVAVDVEDARPPLAGQAHEVGEDARIEPPAPQVPHRDALLLQAARARLRAT